MLKKYRKIEHILIGISLFTFACIVTTMFSIHFKQSLNTKVLLQIHQLKVIAKDIVYHDEVLTMSARVNILNNKPYWLERYRQHSQLLDQALANAKSNDVPIDGLLLKLQAANQSLIAIEESAFKLIDEGKKQQATNLLFDDEYTTKKLVYAHNIEGIVEQTSIFEQNLAYPICSNHFYHLHPNSLN